MLRRALQCLVAQDFNDWVCEVRNDCPEDAATVQDVVDSLGDPRFEVVHHQTNLGGTRCFNLMFSLEHREPFFSILEDDNYWDDNFLSRMVAAIRDFPEITAAWSNQRVEVETDDGEFVDIGKLVGPTGDSPRLIDFGDFRQICGNLHSNGAMMVRTVMNRDLSVPPDLPFLAIEVFRDRVFPYPLLYVPEPLAVFTVTRQTSRKDSHYDWILFTSLAAGSFLKFCEKSSIPKAFEFARSHVPRTTNTLLMGLLIHGRPSLAFCNATLMDWFSLLKAFLRHPHMARMFVDRPKFKEWQEFLDKNTQQRFREKAARTPNANPTTASVGLERAG